MRQWHCDSIEKINIAVEKSLTLLTWQWWWHWSLSF